MIAIAVFLLLAQNPFEVAPDDYKLEFENAYVRIVRVTYGPHAKSPLHDHPGAPTVYVYVTDGAKMRIAHEGEAPIIRPEVKAGQIRFSRGMPEHHTMENLGAETSEYIRVELKTKPVDLPSPDVRLSDGTNRVKVSKNRNLNPTEPWIVTGFDPSVPRTNLRVSGASEGSAGPTPPATGGISSMKDVAGAEQEKIPQPGTTRNMDPREIHVDPVRFQFKRDTGGAAGVGDELKGVNNYDPELGGVLSVWHDPADGKTYVVNGHHRLELAERAAAPEVSVRYLGARSAGEARTKGAMINIAEGRGTAIDAAKVMRGNNILAAGHPGESRAGNLVTVEIKTNPN